MAPLLGENLSRSNWAAGRGKPLLEMHPAMEGRIFRNAILHFGRQGANVRSARKFCQVKNGNFSIPNKLTPRPTTGTRAFFREPVPFRRTTERFSKREGES
jgi:hypothetical protein